jgi:glycosyltransferase involved in cell wall biosynthesis
MQLIQSSTVDSNVSEKFDLSICIPTFNRAPNLELTLGSITSQRAFQEGCRVEVVVIDNCSTDDTPEVIAKYSSQYPEKVFHYTNKTAVPGDLNILNAIKLGRGSLVKAHNDNFSFIQGSLDYILALIKQLDSSKPVIFFTNAFVREKARQVSVAKNLDEFVREVSFTAGWIGGFSIWKEYRNRLDDFGRLYDQSIFVIDENYRLIPTVPYSIVIKTGLFHGTHIGPKGGYSLARVFGVNYLNLLKQHVEAGHISSETYAIEKRKVLTDHILKYVADASNNFKSDGFFRDLFLYWEEDYFQEIIDRLFPHFEPTQ